MKPLPVTPAILALEKAIWDSYSDWYEPHPTVLYEGGDYAHYQHYYVRCAIHDRVMEVMPSNRTRALRKHLCPDCDNQQKIDTYHRRYHGRYDYQKMNMEVGFGNNHITVICPDHGKFLVPHVKHAMGTECPECYPNQYAPSFIPSPNSVWIPKNYYTEARLLHGNAYVYPDEEEHTTLLHSGIRINAICPEHGKFNAAADRHINVSDPFGCPDCRVKYLNIASRSRTRQPQKLPHVTRLVEECRLVHGDVYSYEHMADDFKTIRSRIRIQCPTHGLFVQPYASHVGGSKCPRCALLARATKASQSWLDEQGIPIENREVPDLVPGYRYYADGYDPINRTVYEFLGDYHHGNPERFDPTEINKAWGVTFGSLFQKTVDRRNQFLSHGYTVVEMWSSDYKSGKAPIAYRPGG